MQAPILSFDEEGDIPVPAAKKKRMYRTAHMNFTTSNFVFLLGLLSPDSSYVIDSRDNLSGSKSAADSVSIERTRKEKFRHALRSVSKVAFSQLGLGKS